MTKKQLMDAVAHGFSTYEIGRRYGKSQTTVRYWLKKFGLRTQPRNYRANRSADERRRCDLCGKVRDKKKDNYKAKCWACYTKIRRYRFQRAAFAYKGSKCARCGRADLPMCAYDFHHTKLSKEFRISQAYSRSPARVRRELDKCLLLCANCHRVEHAPEPSEEFLRAVEEGKQIVF